MPSAILVKVVICITLDESRASLPERLRDSSTHVALRTAHPVDNCTADPSKKLYEELREPSLFSCASFHGVGRTAWSRVLEKLVVPQLVKTFPAFYGTRRLVSVFTTAYHGPLS
jgi:hypothetical protein